MLPLFSAWKEILFLAFILVDAFFVGRQFLKWLKINFSSQLEGFVFSTAIGLGVIAYSILFLGACGVLYRSVVWVLLVVFFLLFVVNPVRKFGRGFLSNRQERFLCRNPYGFPTYISVAIIVVALFLTVVSAVVPPVYYDILLYHYGAPNIYIQNHKIVYIPEIVHSNFPFTVEMLYTLGLLIGRETLANLINMTFGILSAMSVWCLTRKYFSKKVALLATAVFSSSASVIELSVLPTVDIALTFFNTLLLLSLLNWLHNREQRWLYIMGVFAGICMGIKYTAMLLCFGLGFIIIATRMLIDREGKLFKKVFIYSLVAFAIFSPWLIKNLYYTGNPVHPGFYNLFDGKDWSLEQERKLAEIARHVPFNFKQFLLLPYNLLFNYQKEQVAGFLGLVFSIFVPTSLVLPKKDRIIKFLILYSLIYFIFWALSFWMIRFLVPVLGVLSVIVAYTIDRLQNFKRPIKILANICFIGCIIANFFWFTYFNKVTHTIFLRGVSAIEEEEFFETLFPPYFAMEYANEHLPPQSFILFFGETRHSYCRVKYICNTAYNKNPLAGIVKASEDGEEILKGLHRLGITHILFSPSEASRLEKGWSYLDWEAEDYNKFNRFLSESVEIMYHRYGIFLLKIKKVMGSSL